MLSESISLSERGEDQRVIKLIKDIFDIDPLEQYNIAVVSENVNSKGGTATFIPQPDETSMHEALSNHAPPADIQFIPNPRLKTDFGKFSYIHKVKAGRHIYYFANSSDESISCKLVFKGKLKLGQWEPHTGEIIKHIPIKTNTVGDQEFTKIDLELDPISSLFFVSI